MGNYWYKLFGPFFIRQYELCGYDKYGVEVVCRQFNSIGQCHRFMKKYDCGNWSIFDLRNDEEFKYYKENNKLIQIVEL